MDYTIQVTGLDELIKKCNDPALIGEPMREFFNNSVLSIQRDAQQLTPVDTGRLRASETVSVDPSPTPLWGEVGTNVYYGPFIEYGTRPHWPPVSALQGWAGRHNINAFALARAISRRGTRARLMFQTAAQQNISKIQGYLAKAASDIESRWGGI